MGLPNKDELEGKFDRAKGAAKETVGRVINDRDLEAEGERRAVGWQSSGGLRQGQTQSWRGH